MELGCNLCLVLVTEVINTGICLSALLIRPSALEISIMNSPLISSLNRTVLFIWQVNCRAHNTITIFARGCTVRKCP